MIALAANWSLQGVFYRPSCIQSIFNGSLVYSGDFFPFRKAKSLLSVGYFSNLSTVSGLLKFCSPPTVVGRVVSVIVNPIKSHVLWRLPHILKKVFKVMPSFADFYSAATIIFKVNIFRVIAPGLHVSPNAKKFSFSHAMFSVFFPYLRVFHAATGTTISKSEGLLVDGFNRAADTSTIPKMSFTARFQNVMRKIKRCPVPKFLIGNVSNFAQGDLR